MMPILRLVIRRNKLECLYVKSSAIHSLCSSFHSIERTMSLFFKGIKRESSFTFILIESSKSFLVVCCYFVLLHHGQENSIRKQK